MATYQHPTSLNPLKQFGQACSILHHTSRASNPAWYQEALELTFQLHLRPDGQNFSSFYYDRKKDLWSPGPAISEALLEDPGLIDPWATEILKFAKSQGAHSLGVILHIADDFATTELKPELDNPASLPDLRDTAVFDPAAILADSTIQVDQASWRVIPYPAAGSDVMAATVTHNRHYTPLLEQFRKLGERENFPIIPHALSAPLVAITGLAAAVQPTAEKPYVAILQYPWFTTLAFFNEFSDLRLIRTLHHHGARRANNLRNALTTTNASLEFVDPDLFIIQLGQNIDSTLEANLKTTHPNNRVEIIRFAPVNGVPEWCAEPGIATQLPNNLPVITNSHTFTVLGEEKWALQNFLPTPKETTEIYPNKSEMRLLRLFSLARVALFAVTVICLAYLAFGVVDLVRRPGWTFDPQQNVTIKARLNMFNSQVQKSDHWDNLLQDRSKAWTAMESLARMFPENRGLLVKAYTHTSKPDNTRGQAKVGFVKEWHITGYARDEATDYLNSLNSREGINTHFMDIARATANPAYDLDSDPKKGYNRSVAVNIRTQENSTFKPTPVEETSNSNETTYPFTFDITITQRFEATDPLAITVPKVP